LTLMPQRERVLLRTIEEMAKAWRSLFIYLICKSLNLARQTSSGCYRLTTSTKYFRSTMKLTITVGNAHPYHLSKSRRSLSAPPAWIIRDTLVYMGEHWAQ